MIFISPDAPACAGPCARGRTPCPMPDLCRVSSILSDARTRCREQMLEIDDEEADRILAAQAQGARMSGSWPWTGIPTTPGGLTEAEVNAHNAEMHPRMPRPRPPVLPKFSGFDELVAEMEANPTDARHLKSAREWVRRNFYSATKPGDDPHPAEAISGPHRWHLGVWQRIVWRWREWRAGRMGPAL